MKKWKVIFPAALLLAAASSSSIADSVDPTLVAKGEYVSRVADCIACHTALNGQPFAGGLKIGSPIGAMYSTNITPDPVNGIGNYTLEEFDKAVRSGIRKDGTTLYPAMPYPSFSRMSDDDIKALYAFFMHGVKPIAQPNKPVDISWPMSMRWPVAMWRMMFAPTPKPFSSAPGVDPAVARGEYLVTGAGHCGACHSPRGVFMQEKALDGQGGSAYLSSGAPIDNWVAPNLRNDAADGLANWSEDDIFYFLKTGRTDKAAVFGGMADVVAWSTRHLNDDDLHAMAKYLKTLGAGSGAAFAYDKSDAEQLDAGHTQYKAGAEVYVQQCAVCHRNDGGGVNRMFPPLAGNAVLLGSNPISVSNVIVHGGVLPATNWGPSSVAMPGFAGKLSDAEIADVSNFVRTSWGNKATGTVQAADIAKLRQEGTPAETSGWPLIHPQPFGNGWTFSPQTHMGADSDQ